MPMGVAIYLSKGNLLMAPLLLSLLSNYKLPVVSQGEMEPYEPLPHPWWNIRWGPFHALHHHCCEVGFAMTMSSPKAVFHSTFSHPLALTLLLYLFSKSFLILGVGSDIDLSLSTQ